MTCGKDPDTGVIEGMKRRGGHEEKETAEDEVVGWHH